MAELIDLKELEERVILIAVNVGDERETSASLDELEELAQTAEQSPLQGSFRTVKLFILGPIWEKGRF